MIELDARKTNAASLFNLFASLDGGVSWHFCGHIHAGKSFIGQPNFLRLDSEDREAVLDAIAEAYPDYHVAVIKPIPPGLDFSGEDDPPPPPPTPPKSDIIIP